MSLAAELAQVDAANLAAALGCSFAAQVAAQRAVRRQTLPKHLVQRQVVGAQTLGSGRRQVHLGVTGGTQHGDAGSVLARSFAPADVRGGHREGLQLPDTVRAEGVQTREDFRLPVQASAHVTHRLPVHRDPVMVLIRVRGTFLGVYFPLGPRHVCFG